MDQNLSPKAEKFMHFEKLLFRVQYIVLGIGIFILTFLLSIAQLIGDVNDFFKFIVWVGFIYPAIQLIVSIIRIFKYLFVIRHEEGKTSIWRSALSFLFSPLIFGIFYAIFFILVLASCAANA